MKPVRKKYYVTGCPNGYILKNGYCQYETEDAYIVLNAPPAQGGVSSHQTMTFYFYDENGNPSFDGTTTVTALPTYTANVGYSNMSWSPYNPLGKTFTLDELRQEWPKFSVIFTSIIPPPTQP